MASEQIQPLEPTARSDQLNQHSLPATDHTLLQDLQQRPSLEDRRHNASGCRIGTERRREVTAFNGLYVAQPKSFTAYFTARASCELIALAAEQNCADLARHLVTIKKSPREVTVVSPPPTRPVTSTTLFAALRHRRFSGFPKVSQSQPRSLLRKTLASSPKPSIPTGWKRELLKAGFAITHDKIVVIDPFADDCTVMTGSHNLAYQASYNNHENLVMIQGNKKLAMAYATHVLDVYDHFAWRWTTKQGMQSTDYYLKQTPNEWLNWYFDSNRNIKTAQLKFWMQATV
jgi:phosphatidylserine/phosphatidylglycerophosphate/cardiolipin synthase-like enzyme